MRNLLHIIVIFSCMLVFQSCMTSYMVSIQPELEEVFVGKTYADIVEYLSAPDRTTSDGKDGQILVYEDVTFTTDSHVSYLSNNIKSFTSANKGYVHFFVNGKNICYAVKTNKEREEREFSKGKTIGLISAFSGTMLLAFIVTIGDEINQLLNNNK